MAFLAHANSSVSLRTWSSGGDADRLCGYRDRNWEQAPEFLRKAFLRRIEDVITDEIGIIQGEFDR